MGCNVNGNKWESLSGKKNDMQIKYEACCEVKSKLPNFFKSVIRVRKERDPLSLTKLMH